MKRHEIVAMLRQELQSVTEQRQISKQNAATFAALSAVKRFQSKRMENTHADLLASPETNAAAQFFLTDLYGEHDVSKRDADVERVIPSMERLLPVPALQTLTEAIMLDALSESLDTAMALRLGERFDESEYIVAYREVTRRVDREHQLAYVNSLGNALCDLLAIPFIATTLKIMRGPAKLANLIELHDFLERGFTAFKKMENPRFFVSNVMKRETIIMDNLYSGKEYPFTIHE
jgi:hypothetical protein